MVDRGDALIGRQRELDALGEFRLLQDVADALHELADLEQAARLYHAIPAAELAIVPGASHGAADRGIYWDLVLDFLDRRA